MRQHLNQLMARSVERWWIQAMDLLYRLQTSVQIHPPARSPAMNEEITLSLMCPRATIPLLATKLYIPSPRSELVSRPRLIERLNTGLTHKLTLISAPAGFGKTTLLSEWIHCNGVGTGAGRGAVTAPLQVAWLSLDEGDNDLNRFLTYFVAALQTVESDVGHGPLAALQAPGAVNVELVLTTLLNEIASLPDRLILILDDYHVIESPPIDQALTFLLNHLPANMHLGLATRTDPPLPLSRLRGRGQMTELRTADLRFSPDEVGAFLNQAMGLGLSVDDVAALGTRTEGWIVGLQLAALSLQEREDATAFIRSFTGSHHHILDYLVEEVLRQQSASTRSFLLQTSILERMSGSLCDEVCSSETSDTDKSDGQAMLERLARSNLFIVPLDDERRWYHYHHLFADLLRYRLQRERAGAIPGLYRRSSEWHEQNGFITRAIDHAVAGGDMEQAARLVEEHYRPTLRGGK